MTSIYNAITAVRGGVPLPLDEPTLPLRQPTPVKARGLGYQVALWEKELAENSTNDAEVEEDPLDLSTNSSPTSSSLSLDSQPATPPNAPHKPPGEEHVPTAYGALRYGAAWATACRVKTHGYRLAEARERADPAHRQRLLDLLNGGTQRRYGDHGPRSRPLDPLWELETPPSDGLASASPLVF